MNKLIDACNLLKELGLPKEQTNERAGLVLLALARLAEQDSWASATNGM